MTLMTLISATGPYRAGALLFRAAAIAAIGSAVLAQVHVEHVDFYGVRTVNRTEITAALALNDDDVLGDRKEIRERLRAIDGIADAVVLLMRSPNKTTALVGILEDGAPALALRSAPSEEIVLPDAIQVAHREGMRESMAGFRRGVAGEDRECGHAVSRYGPARRHDLELERLLAEPGAVERVRRVLRHARDDEQRQIAARAVAFAPDKAEIVPDLEHAMTDADSGVRNNAVRALSVLARWARDPDVDFDLHIDSEPLLVMLESLQWTDRNKSAALLDSLSAARDPGLLAALRSQSLPALREMGEWYSFGHAAFSLRILLRLAEVPEAEIEPSLRELRALDLGARSTAVRDLVRRARAAG